MKRIHHTPIPGQFPGTSLFPLAVRGGLRDPMPAPATDGLRELLEDRPEYIRRVSAALKSDYTRDILDGAAGAMMLGRDAEVLIPFFEEVIEDCKQEQIWEVIEPDEGCTLASTLCMIRIDLLIALREIGSPQGLPLALQSLSDQDDSYHTFGLDVIEAIGPAAADAIPHLVEYICLDAPADLTADHHQYRHGLRLDACYALGAIQSMESLVWLWRITASDLSMDVRDAARRTANDLVASGVFRQ